MFFIFDQKQNLIEVKYDDFDHLTLDSSLLLFAINPCILLIS